MSPGFAKAVIILAGILMVVIRAPHGQRSRSVKVVKDGKDLQETALLALAWTGFFIPLIWAAAKILAFADYTLRVVPFSAGILGLSLGLWLFHRSHADLGTNWSVSLQIREDHKLVTHGIYRRVRHPMYSGFLVYGLGQALVIPNWFAGPSFIVAFAILVALRLPREERLMLEQFGTAYEAYRAQTGRLIPGVWSAPASRAPAPTSCVPEPGGGRAARS